jgi:tripartite-type tricarboxylate transporter receptor subunit TctC
MPLAQDMIGMYYAVGNANHLPPWGGLADEVKKALDDPEVKDKLNAQGLTPRGTTPEELGTATRAQLAKYGELIRKNGITSE